MPDQPFLIDTHCHLDAAEFDRDRDAVRTTARANGIGSIVIPAIAVSNFAAVARLAHETAGGCYALGIHPIVTPHATREDIATLRRAVEAALDDDRFVAIGEIGLDLFVPSLATPAAIERQTWFFDRQLEIARDFDLPVLLHVRRAQDQVLAGLRRVRKGRASQERLSQGRSSQGPVIQGDLSQRSTSHGHERRGHATGIAHAFNGSRQQAEQYVALGFKLGFGGASTFERALRIRALARDLPIEAMVLETDAPDIAPAWLHRVGADAADGTEGHVDEQIDHDAAGRHGRNAPGELRRIAEHIAALRGIGIEELAERTTTNARVVLPRLAAMLAAMPAGRSAERSPETPAERAAAMPAEIPTEIPPETPAETAASIAAPAGSSTVTASV